MADFGDPRLLAGSLAHELAPATGRRTGATLLVTGPLVGLVWAAAYGTGSANWLSDVVAVLSSVPIFQLVLLVAIPAALMAVAGPGVLARRLTLSPGLVPVAAIIATCAVVLGDATLVGTTLAHARGITVLAVAAILVSVGAGEFGCGGDAADRASPRDRVLTPARNRCSAQPINGTPTAAGISQ